MHTRRGSLPFDSPPILICATWPRRVGLPRSCGVARLRGPRPRRGPADPGPAPDSLYHRIHIFSSIDESLVFRYNFPTSMHSSFNG